METYFEVWDDATGNRVGGSYATLAEAREMLAAVLRVNGVDAAQESAIIAFHPGAGRTYELTTVLEGADFVAEERALSRRTATSA